MRAVWLVLLAGCRRQWRSWVLLGLLIAVASGFVLASTAAGRRTDSAFPRYVASHGYDAVVYTFQPLPQLGQLPAASQRQAVFNAMAGNGPIPKPAGARMTMRVVGIAAAENEFSYGQGVTYTLYPGPGFAVATKSAARSRPGPLLRTE